MPGSPQSHAVASAAAARPSPRQQESWLQAIRRNLFSSWLSGLVSLVLLAVFAYAGWQIINWVVIHAVWITDTPSDCEAVSGACWAIISEKHRLIFFGTYPYEQQWRPLLAILLVLGTLVISGFRRFWSPWLLWVWLGMTPVVVVLMLGGVPGLPLVGTHLWGGLPLTLLIALVSVLFGLPGAILLALGRRSGLPVIKMICVAITEITRGLPLLVVLFTATVMLPLFLPAQVRIDKFVATQIAMAIYFAAYAAEIVRGGLQAVPRGQYEAAEASGLRYGQRIRRIILPQGLRIVIPALMNDIIRAFKNTTFVSILGLFDILGATNAATQDPAWVRYAPEAYIFIFVLYFIFCFSMSKYSQSLEKYLSEGRNY